VESAGAAQLSGYALPLSEAQPTPQTRGQP
jgi:hypothetical protein